jgi:predicted transcriptional regulator YdeE
MEPQIVEKTEKMMLVGIVASGPDVSLIDYGALWQRFKRQSERIPHRVEGKGYELHIQEETEPTLHLCMIGVEVRKISEMPPEMFAKVIPAGSYAVFTHRMEDGGFGQAFSAVYGWLKDSAYTSAYPFDIQCYDDRFQGSGNPQSVLEILVPVVLRPG